MTGTIESAMLPLKIQELAEIIQKKTPVRNGGSLLSVYFPTVCEAE